MIWWFTNAAALLTWLAVLLAPAKPHGTRERLEPRRSADDVLDDVTVLVPARNEAAVIAQTLEGLRRQGRGLEVVVIDDQSEDETAAVVARFMREHTGSAPCRSADGASAGASPLRIELLSAGPMPEGWGGKLWALQQGLDTVRRPYVLLLDADIELAPGMISALLAKARGERLALVSIMATLRCEGFWERLLVPAFVLFFKLLYPFAWVSSRHRSTAAAAGGCVLVESAVLREVGAFGCMRDALIDDCALASRVKRSGHGIWLGLSRSVVSLRPYDSLRDFWRMVSRTAFTQLGYSVGWLLLTSAAMFSILLMPPLGIVLGSGAAPWAAGGAFAAMALVYAPMVRFYGLNVLWSFTLPLSGALFLLMTWSSAAGYWRGKRAAWKNRVYEVSR